MGTLYQTQRHTHTHTLTTHTGAQAASQQQAGGAAGGSGAGRHGGEDDEGEATSGPPPVRWRWLVLSFTFPANAVRGSPLQDVQVNKLLQDLNDRLQLTADAAVYKHRQAVAAAAAGAGAEGAGQGAVAAGGGGATPVASSLPAASTAGTQASGLSGVTRGTEAHVARHLALIKQHEADEVSAPLAAMHCVLADVGGRLLLDAAMSVTQRLVGKGGRWEGHGRAAHTCMPNHSTRCRMLSPRGKMNWAFTARAQPGACMTRPQHDSMTRPRCRNIRSIYDPVAVSTSKRSHVYLLRAGKNCPPVGSPPGVIDVSARSVHHRDV